jgi:outer membrane protein assembly factor BamB
MATPLLLLQLPILRALDPKTGAQLWESRVGEADPLRSSPGRFLVTPHGIFVMAGPKIWLFDATNGSIKAKLELPFSPDTAIFEGDAFYVAAVPEAACIGVDGETRWRISVEGSWSKSLICRDADHKVIWQRDAPKFSEGAAAGLALGDQVAQPDDKGLR